MAKHRRKAVKKAAFAGVAVASAVSLGVVASPGMPAAVDQAMTVQQAREIRAQFDLMVSSTTQVVGVPDILMSVVGAAGLNLGGGNILGGNNSAIKLLFPKNDADEIYQNILKNQDTGLSLGDGVELGPRWNTSVASFEVVSRQVPNGTFRYEASEAYKLVYDPAYDLGFAGPQVAARQVGYEDGYAEAKNDRWNTTYSTRYLFHLALSCRGSTSCANDKATTDANNEVSKQSRINEFIAAGNAAGDAAELAAKKAAGIAAGENAIALANQDLPDDQKLVKDVKVENTDTKWFGVYTTKGEWGSPNSILTGAAGLANWTGYLNNTNLLAYADGVIPANEAYRRMLLAAGDGDPATFPVGDAKTGPREIRIIGDIGTVMLPGEVALSDNEFVRAGQILAYRNGAGLPTPPKPSEVPDYEVVKEGGVLDITAVLLAYLRNPGRPNGGIYSRFAPVYEGVTGIDPVTDENENVIPDGVDEDVKAALQNGDFTGALRLLLDDPEKLDSVSGQKLVFTLAKFDLTWAYDWMSDAPVNANPVAWANSLAAGMLIANMLSSATGDGLSGMKVVTYTTPEGNSGNKTTYMTLTTEELPIVLLAKLPTNLLNTAMKATGTDLALTNPGIDAMTPLLRILTNIGYTDVVTPEDLDEGGKHYGSDYDAYDRTYREMHTPVLFGSQTLRQSEIAHLQGDLIAALAEGLDNGWDSSIQHVAYRLVDALGGDQADIKDIIEAPGNTIREVGAKVGDFVSDTLVKINKQLPQLIKTDDPEEQKMLASIYKPLGQGLKPVAEGVAVLNEGFMQLDSVLTGGQLTKLQKDPIGSLITAGADLQKSGVKLQKSLTKAQKDANDLVKAVTSGDPSKIGETVKEKVDYRIDRTKRDLDNGVAKVKEAAGKVKEAVKKVTDKVTKKDSGS